MSSRLCENNSFPDNNINKLANNILLIFLVLKLGHKDIGLLVEKGFKRLKSSMSSKSADKHFKPIEHFKLIEQLVPFT
jgi:hypothetical protein